MPEQTNSPMKEHYEKHLEIHPDAAPYDKLTSLIQNGDEFGFSVPIARLCKLAKISRQRFYTWLPKWEKEGIYYKR